MRCKSFAFQGQCDQACSSTELACLPRLVVVNLDREERMPQRLSDRIPFRRVPF